MADEEKSSGDQVVLSYEEQLKNVNEIATPMASKKVVKRVYKAIKTAKGEKNQLRRGLKEVTKALKKKEKGFVVFAGDVRPVEIYCHLVGCCEDAELPYCFTPSKQLLGSVINSKRPTCVVLVRESDGEVYEKALAGVKKC